MLLYYCINTVRGDKMHTFNANIPIYLQVVDEVKLKIMNGTLKPGDKIASVREMAMEMGVNPNTIQRAYAELEREGFIRTERAVGKYVSENTKLIEECRYKLIRENIHQFLMQMKLLGLGKKDIMKYLEEDNDE